jgi:hypothetical protein
MRKYTVVILNQFNIKNNKIDKDNFEKNHKKIMWGNTVAIHSVLKKKTTKLNSQPAQYEKKNRQRQFWKKIIKKGKKNNARKHCSNPRCFKERKTTNLNSQLASY